MGKRIFTGTAGLSLPRRAVKILSERGISARLSVEHQQLAGRYVLRGLESGGSTADIGRYVTFAGQEGQPLECLHPVEALAANGLHAVVISSGMIRVDMLRKDRTYELLITAHSVSSADNRGRPELETEILFRGIHGRLELDLSRRDRAQAGRLSPSFYSLGGEEIAIPESFVPVVRAATHGANCIGCSHSHYLRKQRVVQRNIPAVRNQLTTMLPASSLRSYWKTNRTGSKTTAQH
jgi:hypothetical protein